MARRAKTTKTAKPAVRGRKAGHPVASAKRTTKKAAKTAKRAVSTASPKHTPPKAPAAPKLSKDELHAQVEKLEHANANLRAKNREASREAKTTAARIAVLEEQVARLEKRLAAQAAGAGGDRATRAPKVRRTRHREIDPGDSVPPGVAVEEPAPLDLEAENALANLEEHLGDETPLDPDAETTRENAAERLEGETPLDPETETAQENLGEQPGGE
jgi:chromosome segregation ATPase